jgi:putative sugar O-methyltransferase
MSAESEHEREVVARVEREWQAYCERGLLSRGESDRTRFWEDFRRRGSKRLFSADGRVDVAALRSFRRRRILVGDNPKVDPGRLRWRHRVDGGRRGEDALLRECLRRLRAAGYEPWLAKYPCSPVGRPRVFEHEGLRYTHRWYRHVHALGVFADALAPRLPDPFVGLDIGSSYGIFPSLLHQERPGSRWILVDFPESLLLARYFLSLCHPQARIGGVEDLAAGAPIGREQVERFDFLLLPPDLYPSLVGGSADLVTSFACLGEVTRPWFERYLDAPVFRDAQWFFTINPVVGGPIFATDVSILDYPIWDPKKRLHFAVSPAYFHPYAQPQRRWLVSFRMKPFTPFFEWAGRI